MIISRPKKSALVGMICLLIIGFLAAVTARAEQFTVNVVNNAGADVNGFRWILQEDMTSPVDPNNPPDLMDPNSADELLSLGFHASYHPIAQNAAGDGLNGNSSATTNSVTIDAPPGRYYVSVLPYSGHSIGGIPIDLTQGDPANPINVVVQKQPIPTAAITIFLFHDNFPINGSPDLPEESSPSFLPDGTLIDWTEFSIIVEEPAGRYGMAGGQVIQDVFGNPLGTEYDRSCGPDGAPPVLGDPPGTHACLSNGEVVVLDLGDGTLHPDENGLLTIRNIAPGKYGIIAIPATGSNWQQTSTIEGTKVIDAWVKANEPEFFVEFGPPGPHVFLGFVKSSEDGGFLPISQPPGTTATGTISGTVTDMHLSRAPATQMFTGRPFPGCWVGLNENVGGLAGRGIFAAPCDGNSAFEIPNVPPGDYQLKVFDANMDVVIATTGVTVNADGSCVGATFGCDFSDVPVFNWFARLNTGIFNDENQNGFWDDSEIGIGPESQDVSLRWRDGTMYQNFPTDGEGLAPFDEVFPFFHWLVAEVSFANKKATGATFVVDAGGEIDTTVDTFPGFGELNPQAQFQPDGTTPLPDCNDPDPLIANSEVCSVDGFSRTERGQVLTTGFQGFLGQTSVMQFGKTDYVTFDFGSYPPTYIGENGGISGIVFYATTRAENEPQFAAAEEWEPGVPRVQLALYADGDIDSFPLDINQADGWDMTPGDVNWNSDSARDLDDDIIDDIDGNGCVGRADVDNYPFDNFPGPEDIDRSWTDNVADDDTNQCVEGPGDGVNFDLHDAVQVTWTDSWDDNLPEGCQGSNGAVEPPIADNRCFDGLRNFNQVRPGVFDGGYAFADYDTTHIGGVNGPALVAIEDYFAAVDASGLSPETKDKLQLGLIPGDYIVESTTPPGYKHIKEEDRNVDFGDEYIPASQALAVACVGNDHEVPPYLTMTTMDGSGDLDQLIDGIDPGDAAASFAGEMRPLCDLKKVPLSPGQNAAAEFFFMTDVPVAANVSGITLNDLANEFNPNSPSFSEKFAPPLLPIAFYDWQGKLVNRVYGDAYGRYNAVVPSTFTANLPQPSGMSPNMLISCMNDAGPIPDPVNGGLMIDPFFDSQYSQFCYTFQYMPGTITYLDTPVVSVSAFATSGPNPVDCERPTNTPMIASVNRRNNSGFGGPFVVTGTDTPQQIRIRSMGEVSVPNPEWDGTTLTNKNIVRNYGFSQNGNEVFLEDANGARTSLAIVTNDNPARIHAELPTDFAPGNYQVVVSNGAGVESPMGVTLTVGACIGSSTGRTCDNEVGVRPNAIDPFNPLPAGLDGNLLTTADNETFAVSNVNVTGSTQYPNTPIQDAIDIAKPGDLVLVPPGSYEELVVMWKPVKLQGWGAGEVFLNARQVPTEKTADWREKAGGLANDGSFDRLPGQIGGNPGFPALDEVVFPTEEGAAIFVAGKRTGLNRFGRLENRFARIDGFSILGASTGGGIVANGYNQYLQVSNNRVTGNAGAFGGGVRIGHPQLSHEETNGTFVYDDAVNDQIRIHHNHIAKNGGFGGAGGGISLHTGADRYRVQENLVCGNFTQGNGAGIGHLGLSRNGLIENNDIIFNESFAQANAQSGGGVFIGGQAALQPTAEGRLLTPGSGTVTIDSNVIRGNMAGAGDGGGIRLQAINGADVEASLASRSPWYRVLVYNNMITNNVAGLAGGGISMSDALRVFIRNNTVANNESTATTAEAFMPGAINAKVTVPQPAGIVSRQHSPDLLAEMADVTDAVPTDWLTFSDPVLRDSIVHSNRSFYWTNFDDENTATIETGLVPSTCDTPAAPIGNPNCTVLGLPIADYTDDLGVLSGLNTIAQLNPRFSLLTDTTGYHGSNTTGDPAFNFGYFNGARDNLLIQEFTVLQTAGAFDEGGNYIQVQFGPLSLLELDDVVGNAEGAPFDYHIGAASPAIDAGGNPAGGRLTLDIDDEARPTPGTGVDIGADETQ